MTRAIVALIPYTIFSLFHALTFTRTTLMPQFSSAVGPNGQPAAHPMAKRLQLWVKGALKRLRDLEHLFIVWYDAANYDGAMRAVAFIELLIMFRTLFGALLFRNSLLMPVFYAHFLRQRYYQSPFTRQAIEIVKRHTDAYVNKPGTHPVVVQVWSRFQMVVERWAGSALTPQQPPPPAAAGAARAE